MLSKTKVISKTHHYPKLIGKMAEKGISQESMAKHLGLSFTSFNEKLNCKTKKFDIYQCIQMVKILECTLDDIFFN